MSLSVSQEHVAPYHGVIDTTSPLIPLLIPQEHVAPYHGFIDTISPHIPLSVLRSMLHHSMELLKKVLAPLCSITPPRSIASLIFSRTHCAALHLQGPTVQPAQASGSGGGGNGGLQLLHHARAGSPSQAPSNQCSKPGAYPNRTASACNREGDLEQGACLKSGHCVLTFQGNAALAKIKLDIHEYEQRFECALVIQKERHAQMKEAADKCRTENSLKNKSGMEP
eukprot:scaffold60652_cov20-Tisochrysis_lutea.AAC.1